MNLSDRKKSILKIVVDDYINSATPISSKLIQEKHLSDLSSATIRNELSTLEDLGYLVQPHPSSGRVPSSMAYKLYVSELMGRESLSIDEVSYISNYFENQIVKIEDLVKSAAKLISDLTNYTGVAVPKRKVDERITDIKILKITDTQSLLIIVLDNVTVKNAMLTNASEIDETAADSATMILGKIFKGKSLKQLILDESKLQSEFYRFRYLFRSIIDVLKEYVSSKENDLVLEGQSKILQYPECSDLNKAKQFFDIMDSKKFLLSMIDNQSARGNVEVTINIGNEVDGKGLPTDCSIVTASYKVGDKELGTAGVIGPRRMKYAKVVSVLDSVGATLNQIVEEQSNKICE